IRHYDSGCGFHWYP
ncbi:type 1 secretion C-target domain protein, partial [Vibrio parahaemolyticus AQ3810]